MSMLTLGRSLADEKLMVNVINRAADGWMSAIVNYLRNGTLLED